MKFIDKDVYNDTEDIKALRPYAECFWNEYVDTEDYFNNLILQLYDND